jgi:hypothetical protein
LDASYFSAALVAGLFSGSTASAFFGIKKFRKLVCEHPISGAKIIRKSPFSHNDKLRNILMKNTISWAGVYRLTGYVVVVENSLKS